MLKDSRPQDLRSFIFSICPVPGEGEGDTRKLVGVAV